MENKRKQIIIKNHFQHRLIINTLLMTIVTLNLILVASYFLESVYGSSDSIVNVFTASLGVMELVAIFAVYYISRRISFRIAGPIYAIERTLNSMSEGELSLRLKLRADDYFDEVADALNRVLDIYQARIASAQSRLASGEQLSEREQRRLAQDLNFFITHTQD